LTPPERDYSHRTLIDKLGVFVEARAALIGRHDEFLTAVLKARLGNAPVTRLRATYDLIFLHVGRTQELARITAAAKHLEPDGALWIFHPKGRLALPRDADVRSAALAVGLVDAESRMPHAQIDGRSRNAAHPGRRRAPSHVSATLERTV
jgi:hypothetical protein